jgi:hypothetical protein
MIDEFMVYTVEVSYDSMVGNLRMGLTARQNVQGREQRDNVLAWLREQGLRPTWSIYQGLSQSDAVRAFATDFQQFKPIGARDESAPERTHA